MIFSAFVCGLSIRRCGHGRSGEKLKEISSHVMTFGGFVVSGWRSVLCVNICYQSKGGFWAIFWWNAEGMLL
jgi:hypothetical protein